MTDEEPIPTIATVLGLATIEDRYGTDDYGRTDDWVEGLPDLGENASVPIGPEPTARRLTTSALYARQ